jgi:hypothetical protein
MRDTPLTFLPDSAGINRLFAAYESGTASPDCGSRAGALASETFRFMMLDEDLLAYSLRNACDASSRRRVPHEESPSMTQPVSRAGADG